MCRAGLAQGYPPARLGRRFALSQVDALVDIKIGCGLRRQVPVRLELHTITRLRITVLLQRWPACRGYCSGACESMPRCAVAGLNADTRIDQEAAVLVGQHFFGIRPNTNETSARWAANSAAKDSKNAANE